MNARTRRREWTSVVAVRRLTLVALLTAFLPCTAPSTATATPALRPSWGWVNPGLRFHKKVTPSEARLWLARFEDYPYWSYPQVTPIIAALGFRSQNVLETIAKGYTPVLSVT